MASILVVGCGDIGYSMALALHNLGHQVVGLKRRPPEKPTPFPILVADIRHADTLLVLSPEFDLVLFIVAPGSRQLEAYQALYQSGLENMLTHFASAAVAPKWLMVSSSSVYGQNQGEWVDEDSLAQPASATSQCLVAAEQLLWAADASHCVVRFSGIYGPGRDWLIRRAAQGEAIQQTPPSYTNRIHRDDCVGVLLFLINKLLAGERLHSCYLASDNDPAPLWDVMAWIAGQYGFPAPVPLNLPGGTLQNKRCSNARLTALGYEFLFQSYRDGYVNPVADGFVK
ncbi:SDR family oxidoreductase [Methylomonas methanica]|uniref:NAD-dependent epimerase/dehydratase n=1 Tax=Methylomonas methanica (strain DSM 25384 / MC09) TaxID=857087 RepID=G0A1U0_METMM|nr:SDR family oxidoreductase [Methylomonas methanica]AEG01323.1 NAD-dependent epimerase/dehydratase [Methylomonas methanica MC09]